MNTAARSAISFFFLLMIAPALMAASPGAVYLNSIEGNVEHISSSQKVTRAKSLRPLTEGDTIAVPSSGNAEIFVRDGSIVRITDGSRLKVLAIERTAVQFFLESGKAYVRSSGLSGYPLFVSTPSAQLDAYDRCVFRLDITSAGDTEASVYSGQLNVAQPKGRMMIAAGTRLIMKKDGGAPVYTTNRSADAWDAWNRGKDGPDRGAPLRPDAPVEANPAPMASPPVAYPPPPFIIDREYVYVAPEPYWGYSYYYPWGYRPYPWRWYGPGYYRGWGPRPWHGYNHGYRGRPYGPGPYRHRR